MSYVVVGFVCFVIGALVSYWFADAIHKDLTDEYDRVKEELANVLAESRKLRKKL